MSHSSQEEIEDSFQSSKSTQINLWVSFLVNASLEFFYKTPLCSTMKVLLIATVFSILSGSFVCKESAMVAFIFP